MLAPATAALLDSWEIPAEMRPVSRLPNAKSSVARSSSQGSTRRNVCGGVLMRSTAPVRPPTMLVTISGIITRLEISRCLRYAPPLAVTPIQSASVLVALAATGPTPVNSSAGKAMKLPPPATALSAPPKIPAANKKMACGRVKAVFVSRMSRPTPPLADWPAVLWTHRGSDRQKIDSRTLPGALSTLLSQASSVFEAARLPGLPAQLRVREVLRHIISVRIYFSRGSHGRRQSPQIRQ